MAKDYFQSDEFKELLNFYERRKKRQKSIYLDAEDFADLADHYLSNDQPSSAMEAVEMGLAIHQDSDALLIMKSAIYIYQFKFQKAEAILAELDESNPDVLYQLAQLQYAQYLNIPKAEEMWHEWLRMESEGEEEGAADEYRRENYIHIISTLAVLREPDGKSDDKKLITNTIRRWVSEYIDIFQPLGKSDHDIQLADICQENELHDLLCKALSQVLEERPYLPKGWCALAVAHYTLMDYELALEACAFALAINPNDMDAILTKAYTLYDMGDGEGARPVFKEYLDKGGDPVQILPYSEMLFHDGDRNEASAQLEFLTQHLEKEKDGLMKQMDSTAKNRSGKEYQQACKTYEDFMEMYRRTLHDIGDIYYRNKCYEESCKVYIRLLENGSDSSDTYFMIALNHMAEDNIEAAIYSFGQAFVNARDKVMAGIDIAMTLAINNYDSLALKVLRAIEKLATIEESPAAVNIAAAKSLTYLKLGYAERFLASFKTACENTPDLIQKVYENYFPADLPVDEWYAYAQREIQTLLKKISKEDVHIAGF